MIIATFVPHNFMMDFNVVKCWLGIPKLNFQYAYFESPLIEDSRNKAIEMVRNAEEDLLMIDSDMLFTPNDIMKIYNHIRHGIVITGIYPICLDNKVIPTVYRLDGELYNTDDRIGFFEADASGCGFFGIPKEVILKLPKNPFNRIDNFGEDISFCRRLKELNIKLFCDTSIRLAQSRISRMELPTNKQDG